MILATAFAYNERNYIDDWVRYYRSQGCELFVIDNMSTDGTYERLIELDVPCARFDTHGAFHLDWLQEALTDAMHQIKPDWVVYTGIDLFHVFKEPISTIIQNVEAQGYNSVSLDCWAVVHTGETDALPLHKHFFYANMWRPLVLIGKYSEGFRFDRDNLIIENQRTIHIAEGFSINYGAAKPKHEQEVKLARRRKAWEQGLNKIYGKHYETGKAQEWRFEKGTDIRDNGMYDVIRMWL